MSAQAGPNIALPWLQLSCHVNGCSSVPKFFLTGSVINLRWCITVPFPMNQNSTKHIWDKVITECTSKFFHLVRRQMIVCLSCNRNVDNEVEPRWLSKRLEHRRVGVVVTLPINLAPLVTLLVSCNLCLLQCSKADTTLAHFSEHNMHLGPSSNFQASIPPLGEDDPTCWETRGLEINPHHLP